jgi:hypothetical protein
MKHILENEPGYFVWPMVLTFSFLGALHPSKLLSISNYLSFPLSFFGDVFIQWLFGILVFLIYSWVVLGVGKWSGGKGTYLEVKTACAWAYPPLFVGLLLVFLMKISKLKMVFQGGMDLKDYFSAPMADWHHIFTVISFLLAFWWVGLTVINVAQAHKISIWKSVFATTIVWVLGWLIALVIVLCFFDLFNNPH